MFRSVRLWSVLIIALLAVSLGCAAQPEAQPQPSAPQVTAPAPTTPQSPAPPLAPQQPAAAVPAAPAAPALSAPTSVPFAQPGAIPTRAPSSTQPTAPRGPSGTLVVAETDLAFPGTVPSKISCFTQNINHHYGVYEAPKVWSTTDAFIEPNLAESWSYNDSATALTWKLRRGVQFHGGWGEMTAEDWKWSFEDMISDGTIHSNIFISKARVKEVNVIDRYSVQMVMDKPNIFFIDSQFNGPGGCGTFEIVSKNRVETLGSDEAHLDLSGGTGPFQFVKWETGNELIVEAVPGHHRKDSEYARVRSVEIKEQATKAAALAVGEADIALIPVIEADRLRERGLEIRQLNGGGYQRLYPQGRFCMSEDLDGNPVPPRPAYDPTIPWVGDCNSETEQENARKVRWAMSMAIDRQSMVDNLIGGFGRPAGPGEMVGVTYEKYFDDKWTVPYDPAKAREYLAEAGYPNGIEATMHVTTGSHPQEIEMGEAIAKFMGEVGIDVSIEILTYSAFRPSVVARERGGWWFRSSGSGLGLNPEIAMLRRNPAGAFNPGFEVTAPLEIIAEIDACISPSCIDALRVKQWDWWHNQQQIIGVVETFDLYAINPEKVGTWTIPVGGAGLNSFEYVQNPQ